MGEQFTKRIDKKMKHLFDNSDFNVYDKSVINLTVGAPGPDLLKSCSEHFKLATNQRLDFESENESFLFQYGPAVGEYNYRNNLSKFLTEQYQDQVNSENILLTSGATNGLHLILSTLVDMSNGIIFVDELTYMIALEVMAQFPSIKVITVPLTDDGVNTDELKKLLTKYKFTSETKLFWSIYYTIPTYHNPTGILFSTKICDELIEISREYDFLIVCDDVYNCLPYDQHIPPKRLYAYDNLNDCNYKGNVISNGSFSKILSPGIRVGWMECPPRCLEILENSGVLKSGGAVNHYTSGIVSTLMEMGLAKQQLDFYLNAYKMRMLSACKLLKELLPNNCEFVQPKGGYFIWIKLPENINANEFNEFCMKNYHIAVIPGDRFSKDNSFKNYIRITFAFQELPVLEEAIPKLCEALQDFIDKSSADKL